MNIAYHLCKFQISWLSGSNFIEVNVRPPKHSYDAISYHGVSKLAYFVEHDIGYKPFKFQCSRMSGSSFMEGVEPSPQCYNETKKLSACKVMVNRQHPRSVR